MKINMHYWAILLILCILCMGIWIRATAYGDLRLSMGMIDTTGYVEASRASLLSPEMFSSSRLFTTNILYKLANDPYNCTLTVISNPTMGIEFRRKSQACFDRIVILQNIVSIIGWSFLGLITARWLLHPFYKILAVIIILTFGFTPQISEWDSVLSSESLSLSLFAVVAGLMLEIVQRIAKEQNQHAPMSTKSLVTLWWVIFILWVFLRDVHLYACLLLVAMLLPLLVLRKERRPAGLLLAVYALIGMLVFGIYTTQKSQRWELPLTHVLEGRVFSDQGMVSYFNNHFEMPRSQSSTEYAEWFNSRGFRSYGIFLATHPGFVISSVMERSDYFDEGYIQPYFTTSEIRSRKTLLDIGKIAHPETNAVYFIDFILIVSMCGNLLTRRTDRAWAWTWFATWMFFQALVLVLLSFFGDNIGIHRHIFPYVEEFRLLLWIGLLVNMDSLTHDHGPNVIIPNNDRSSTQAKE